MFGRWGSERQLRREQEALEGAAEYLLGGLLRDEDRVNDGLMKADALLSVAVAELAQLAVSALAHERGTTPDAVLRSLVAQGRGQLQRRAGRGHGVPTSE
jgi:hypothetical protein